MHPDHFAFNRFMTYHGWNLFFNYSNPRVTKINIIWHGTSYQKYVELECTAMLVLELWIWEIDTGEALRKLVCTVVPNHVLCLLQLYLFD